ncbi:TetR/AcrR family transcriptional regulator [Streptomyces sp. NPDC048290]|uniref:TetR/AcrR family transcriptional regulator n=1 Tax=Streptomyces sp. NPDC048290 TaxID=3155811 RepID=UPI003426319D
MPPTNGTRPAPPPPTGGRSALKRRAMVTSATELFLAKGYPGTSMDEIAAKAGVSKQTLYKHFSGKEQLFTGLILDSVHGIDSLFQDVIATFEKTADVAEDLRLLAHRCITALHRPEVVQLRRLVISEAERFPDLGRTYYEQGFQRGMRTLAEGFQHLTARGLLDTPDPHTAAEHFAGLTMWTPVNRAMFQPGAPLSPEETESRAGAAIGVFLAAYGTDGRSEGDEGAEGAGGTG